VSTLFRLHRLDHSHRFDVHAGDALHEINHFPIVIYETVRVEFLAGRRDALAEL
jgi:hypothetical protein